MSNKAETIIENISSCIDELEKDVNRAIELEQSNPDPVFRRINQQHSTFLNNVRDRLKKIYDTHVE